MPVIMEAIKHKDITCTVGWTGIHAMINDGAMEMLQNMHPQGEFVKTFGHSRRIRNVDEYRAFLGHRDFFYVYGFYFFFPLDVQGQELLATLMAIYGIELDWYTTRPEHIKEVAPRFDDNLMIND